MSCSDAGRAASRAPSPGQADRGADREVLPAPASRPATQAPAAVARARPVRVRISLRPRTGTH